LISDEAWADYQRKQQRLADMKKLLEATRLTSEAVATCQSEYIEGSAAADGNTKSSSGWTSPIGQTLAQLLKRPEATVEQLVPVLRQSTPEFFARNSEPAVSSVFKLSSEVRNELKSVETEIKYEGYLLQQQKAMDRLKRSEQHSIPEWFDYRSVSGLSREMQEKLMKLRPQTIGQASRIPGVTPAAVSLVNVFIEIQARRRDQAAAT